MPDEDSKRSIGFENREISFSIGIELPPRDIRRFLGGDPNTVKIIDESGMLDGEYRRCSHCDDGSLIEVDHYEAHLIDEHNLKP